jgi:hypothetical protein
MKHLLLLLTDRRIFSTLVTALALAACGVEDPAEDDASSVAQAATVTSKDRPTVVTLPAYLEVKVLPNPDPDEPRDSGVCHLYEPDDIWICNVCAFPEDVCFAMFCKNCTAGCQCKE